MCNKIAVMYLGRIMEYGKTEDLFKNPLHPYTQALLAAVPIPDPRKRSEKKIPSGEIPSALNPPSGCVFHPRCSRVFGMCSSEIPQLQEYESGHFVACHLYS
jgi:oligopeptide/dipeptide ABC transporter ATP-binding protein